MVKDSKRITSSTIASQPFWNLFNLLNNRTNVPDPARPNDSGTTRSRKFVYRRQPNFGQTFAGFPFVIIRATKPSKTSATADLSKAMRNYGNTIEVYSKDSSSDSSGDPNGAELRDQIVNNIIKTLDNSTNQKTLIDFGQARLEYDVDIDDEADLDGKNLFGAEFDLRFNNNLIKTS